MNCLINGKHGKFSNSARKHGRLGRMFVICGYCGEELQATSNGIFDTNPTKYRVSPVKSRNISLRISEKDWNEWKNSGFPAYLVFQVGLSNVLQKPLKS